MATPSLEARLHRLEELAKFRSWRRFRRWLDALRPEELDAYIESDGTLPDPFPDPPHGSVALDHMDEKALRRQWKQDERWWANKKEAQRKV